jgi:hypothetical protein
LFASTKDEPPAGNDPDISFARTASFCPRQTSHNQRKLKPPP